MNTESRPGSVVIFGQVVLVSIYLLIVGLWLLIAGRIKAEGIGKIIRRPFRPTYAGELRDIRHDDGNCWIAILPCELLSDKDGASRLVVCEDDRLLGPCLLYTSDAADERSS